jgi:hypothetical protein
LIGRRVGAGIRFGSGIPPNLKGANMNRYKKQLHTELNRYGFNLCPFPAIINAGVFIYTRMLGRHLVEVMFTNSSSTGAVHVYENGREHGEPSYSWLFSFDVNWLKHFGEVNRDWEKKYGTNDELG